MLASDRRTVRRAQLFSVSNLNNKRSGFHFNSRLISWSSANPSLNQTKTRPASWGRVNRKQRPLTGCQSGRSIKSKLAYDRPALVEPNHYWAAPFTRTNLYFNSWPRAEKTSTKTTMDDCAPKPRSVNNIIVVVVVCLLCFPLTKTEWLRNANECKPEREMDGKTIYLTSLLLLLLPS